MALKEKVKRKSLDLAKKLDIIKKSAVTSKHQLAKDFNLPTVTIRNVLNNRENILQALEEGKNPKCKRMKPPQSPILEASLLNWIGNVRSQDKPVTGDLLKPMDQGIIQNLKVHYRKYLLREHIRMIDAGKSFCPTLLEALRILKRAWDDVKPETIRNCFKEAGFVQYDLMLEVWPDDAIEELVQHEPIEYEPMGNELPFEVDSLVNEPEDYSAFEYLID